MLKEFLEVYCKNGGKITLLSDYLKEGKQDLVILFGGFIRDFLERIPLLKTQENAFLLSPLNYNPAPKIKQFLYEVGCEESLLALLAESLLDKQTIKNQKFLQELDVGYLASEINLAEEEILEIKWAVVRGGKNSLVVGSDITTHKKAKNIAKILALLSQSGCVEVVFLDGQEAKGQEVSVEPALEEPEEIEGIEEVESYDGLVAYLRYDKSIKAPLLEASRQFGLVGKVNDKEKVKVVLGDLKEIEAEFCQSQEIKGMVGILWLPVRENTCFCYQKIKLGKGA